MCDIDLDKVGLGMFVAFYAGFIESEEYGTQRYFKEHPRLSNELIESLLEKNISIIGVEFAGVRRGKEHTPKDQYCADRGVFIIENLCNLKAIVEAKGERLYEIFDFDYIKTAKDNGDKYSTRFAFELAVKGSVQERFTKLYQFVIELVTGRQVTYPD